MEQPGGCGPKPWTGAPGEEAEQPWTGPSQTEQEGGAIREDPQIPSGSRNMAPRNGGASGERKGGGTNKQEIILERPGVTS